MSPSPAPDMPSLVGSVRPLLTTQRFGRDMRGFARLPSTNTEAMAWAAAGAPEGSVVFAEFQSAGRGRQGRSWEADAGHNLTFSVVLYPALPPDRLGLITMAAGVAVAEAVDACCSPLSAAIKWPNDVLVEGRKCCGMLLESSLSSRASARPPAVILGIGLNVNQAAFPPTLEQRATSLLLATGRRVSRAPLWATLLKHLERHYDTLLADEGSTIQDVYERRLVGIGQAVSLRQVEDGAQVSGRLLGVAPTGALRLATTDGERVFHAGDVTLNTRPT